MTEYINQILQIEIKMQEELLEEARALQHKNRKYRNVILYKKINRGYTEYYKQSFSNGKQVRKYISKKKYNIVYGTVNYRFSTLLIQILERNIKALQNGRGGCENWDAETIMSRLPDTYQIYTVEIQALCPGLTRSEMDEWKRQMLEIRDSYPRTHPEKLRCTTSTGEKVRSRSEGNIYELYVGLNYTFIYELPMFLEDGTILYPDFTVLRPDGSTFIHEHDGMFDDRKKRKGTMWKAELYYDLGMAFDKDMIFTFNSPDGSMDMEVINRKIQLAYCNFSFK